MIPVINMFRLPRCHPYTFIAMLVMVGSLIGLTLTIEYLLVDFDNRYSEETCQIKNCTSVTEKCTKQQCEEGCSMVPFPCYAVTFQLEAINMTITMSKMYYNLPTMCAFNTISCWYDHDGHNLLLKMPTNVAGIVTMTIVCGALVSSIVGLVWCIYYLEPNGCDYGLPTPWGPTSNRGPDGVDSFVIAMNRRITDGERERILTA